MKRNSGLALYGLTLGFAAAIGCSAKDDGVSSDELGSAQDPSENPDENGGGSDGAGGGRDAGAGASMDAGDPDKHEIITLEAPDATCAATSAEAPEVVVTKEMVVETTKEEIKPVAIYLMLDRSSSMELCPDRSQPRPQSPRCGTDANWTSSWSQATGAITAFLRDSASANIDVALGYFPPIAAYSDVSATSPLCTGASCATPTVSMRRAADNAAVVSDSLNSAVPSTSFASLTYTPIECALKGLSAFCKDHTARTQQKCVGVLVTDGTPEQQCDLNQDNLVALSQAAAREGTPIFALGMTGANFIFLDRVAMAGGTDCTPNGTGTTAPVSACDVSGGQAAFNAALNAIRETVVIKESHVETHTETVEVPLECEWKLPDPPADMKFDKEKVNVTFSATGKAAMTLGRVASEDECGKHPEGWRYDSEGDPKKVLACPKACETIKTSPGAKISIEFGCQSMTLE